MHKLLPFCSQLQCLLAVGNGRPLLLQIMPVQSLPGPSNIVRGIGEVPPSAKLPDHSKPPIITQYSPQLPAGPGPPPFMHFPPVTPHSGVVPPSIQDVGHLHKQEREQQLALWQQHQLAMHFKQLAEQQQLHPLIIPPPGSAHHPTFSMPVMTSHGHVPQVEPVAFTFNPEEVAAMRSGGGRVEHLAGLIPPGPQIIQSTPAHVPFLDSYQLLIGGRPQEEHMGGLIPLIQAGVPASVEQQQQILAIQQQSLLHLAGLNNMSLQELMETLRQYELVAAQFQKEPALIHDPNVQMILKRREVMMQQMEQLQRMHQEALIQQQHNELLQKQQQQFILARPPHPDEVHSRNRPGVIVGHK